MFLRKIILPAFFVMLASNATPIAAQDDSAITCDDDGNCSIAYEYLATQETDPFLFSGYPMDETAARWHQYDSYIEDFPDVRSCLVEEEQEKENPNLLKIDWKHTEMIRGAEVCVFRIGRSLGSVERIREWLAFQEFDLSPVIRTRSENYVVRFPTKAIFNMSAYWTVEQYREMNPSLLRSITGFDLALHYELVLKFSETHQLVGVHVVIPSK